MIKFDQFARENGLEIQIFLGLGYARFVCAGIEFTEWVMQPWVVEELLEETEEQEE